MSESTSSFPEGAPLDQDERTARKKLRDGLMRGLWTTWILARVIVPVAAGLEVLRLSGALDALGRALAPAMGWWGLPGEASLAAASGALVSLYPTVGIVANLSLSWKQVTVLGLGIGICHELVIEMAVLREVGAPWKTLLAVRVVFGMLAAWLLHLFFLFFLPG
ncbi:MAG: hypothetical protein JSV08_09940 [Acidobacteriota bacterium]|nr:MAG: hypothetical protein JSV08_09940 [Acidobacteriota bacterium]